MLRKFSGSWGVVFKDWILCQVGEALSSVFLVHPHLMRVKTRTAGAEIILQILHVTQDLHLNNFPSPASEERNACNVHPSQLNCLNYCHKTLRSKRHVLEWLCLGVFPGIRESQQHPDVVRQSEGVRSSHFILVHYNPEEYVVEHAVIGAPEHPSYSHKPIIYS